MGGILPQLGGHLKSNFFLPRCTSYSFLYALHQHSRLYLMRCPATSTFPAVEAFARRGRTETRLWLTPSDTFKRSLTPAQRRTLAPLQTVPRLPIH
jgi:hypothetical protein